MPLTRDQEKTKYTQYIHIIRQSHFTKRSTC